MPIQMPKEPMQVMVITVTRDSNQFIARMDSIPDNAIIRMEGQKWNKGPRP